MPEVRWPLRPVADVEAFAIDAASAQIVFRRRPGPARVVVADREVIAPPHDPTIAVHVEGLEPATEYTAVVDDPHGARPLRFRTRPDIGPIRSRFATISDLHLGLEGFGLVRKLRDPGDPPYALRCAIAAAQEAERWGAELLIIKGDITERGLIAEWDQAAELLESVAIPVLMIPGNHEVLGRQEISATEGIQRLGLDSRPVQIRDVAGARIVTADTSVEGRGIGRLSPVRDELLDAVSTDRPVVLALHHNIERLHVPWFWPPGISRRNAAPILTEVAAANRNVFMTAGHTHRHRRHWIGPDRSILFTEVGATSDYPGAWAGYEVSDSAIRQTVRRIADPGVLEWTELTRRAVGGLWPMWSQGSVDDRCIDLPLR